MVKQIVSDTVTDLIQMNTATIIFRHQLFKTNPAVCAGRDVYLVEEFLFFTQYRFHQQKLMFHRASMKAYVTRNFSNGYGSTAPFMYPTNFGGSEKWLLTMMAPFFTVRLDKF